MPQSQPAFTGLRDLIRASRGQPQSTILKEFLKTVIKGRKLSESGSILVDVPSKERLVLFNDGDFLITEDLLASGKAFTLGYFEGIAGRAQRTNSTQRVNHVEKDSDFTPNEEVPIAHMVCAPIQFPSHRNPRPFGVASFHNADLKRTFSEDDQALIEAYTDTLGLLLDASQRDLDEKRNKRIFIVHGRDKSSLDRLKKCLENFGLDPQVLGEKPKTGQELLQMLEGLIESCVAGFVLLTPDDQGRLKGDSKLKERARQNVIFESGLLSVLFRGRGKICFLQKGDFEIPSDMHGLLSQDIGKGIDQEKIGEVLDAMGVRFSRKPR